MGFFVPLSVIRNELSLHYRHFGSCTTIPAACDRILEHHSEQLTDTYYNPFPEGIDDLEDADFIELFFKSLYPLEHAKMATEWEDAFGYLSETLFSKNVMFRVFLHENYAYQGMHTHDFFEITYVYKGECSLQVEDEMIKMAEGNVCIVAPHTQHEAFVLDDESFVVNLSMTEEAFKTAFAVVLLRQDLVSSYIQNILYRKDTPNYLFIPSGNNESMKRAVRHISYENRTDKYYSFSFCISWLSVFMSAVLENYNSDIHLYSNDVKNALQADRLSLLDYIQKNFRTATLESVAKEFNYNSSYLSRLILQLTGRKFIDIITDLKLQAGASLLETADLSLDQISEIIGYNSGDYFSKAFRKQYGVSASEYRKTQLSRNPMNS